MRSEFRPEWLATLKDAKYPTDVVVLDFENYFDAEYNMRGDRLSTIEYVMDDRFENLGVAVLEVGDPFPNYENDTNFWLGEQGVQDILDHLKQRYGDNLEHCTVVAQNAAYDAAILSFRYDIHPPYLIDVLGLARHWNSRTRNDLDSLCKRYDLPVKGDTSKFKGWTFRRRYKKPRSRKKGPKKPQRVPTIKDEQVPELAEYANNDVMREWELFTLLLPKMSSPSSELRVMQHTLDLFLRPCLRVDYSKAEEIKACMEAEIDNAVDHANQTLGRDADTALSRADLSGEKVFEPLLENLIVEAGEDPNYYRKPAKNDKGYKLAIAKEDDARDELEKHTDPSIRAVVGARQAVKAWPLHIKRVGRIVRQAKAAGGRLPVPLKYHGAHTGRWSGGEKINLQNLGSRGHELVNSVRELLLADEGDELVIADSSQIEARVLAWIAGQWDLVEQFENGRDVYCELAKDIVGHRVRKPKDSDPAPIAKRMKDARNKGKVGILGGGYGMGKNKFADSYGLSLDEAETIVQVYRQKNDKIVQFWHDIERAFVYTFKYGEPCQMARGLRFDKTDDCDVILTLPNGRELKYHTVRVKPDYYGESVQVWNNQEKKWAHVWGGHFTENVVQAMSRDILWEGIHRLEKEGHHTALHVHDELIIRTSEGTGQEVLERAIVALSTRPDWAADCPLAAEGLVSKRYGGH